MSKTIINGIDVSECEFYNDYECDAYRYEYWEPQDNTKDMCKWHEDCYFKQLQRLKKENEQLKNKNNDLIEEIASGNIDIAILQKKMKIIKEK